MENLNAENKVQMWWVMLDPPCETPDSISGTGDLLDVRQDDNAPLCPATEADTPLNDYIHRMAAHRLQLRLQVAMQAIAQGASSDVE